MKEKNLRKYHRGLGVVLAIFILAQAGTGLYFTIEKLWGESESHEGHDHANAGTSIYSVPVVYANSNSHEAHNHGDENAGMAHDAQMTEDHHDTGYSVPDEAVEGESDAGPGILSILHYSGGTVGHVYRLLLAVGIILQVLTGLWIYKNIRARG